MSTAIVHVSGTLLSASPPWIRPRLIDGRSNSSEDCARERQRLDRAEHVDCLQHGVVAQPRRRAVGGAPLDLDPHRQHALGLDADVQIGRLTGDRKAATEPHPDDRVGRADVELLGFLVGDADQPHAHALLALEILERAHHRCEPALHVVGATAEQPVALDTRLELLGLARDHVEMAVQHDAGCPSDRAARPDLGDQHRQAVVLDLVHLDVAGFEPSLDESCGRDQLLGA